MTAQTMPRVGEVTPQATPNPFRILPGRHGLFVALAGDTVIGRVIEATGGFAEEKVQLLRALVRPGDTVVDVGANVGTVAIPLARAVGPAGRVIAYEPQRLPFLCLCAAAALNGLANLHPVREAAGAAPGTATLPPLDPVAPGNFYPVAPGNFGGLSLLRAPEDGERVPVASLDALDLPALALLKVDTEGMDWVVLEGAARTIARLRPTLYVEANRDAAGRAAAIARLLAMDYRLYWHLARFVDPATLAPGAANPFPNLANINLLAVPSERGVRVGLPPCTGPEADWRTDLAGWKANRRSAERSGSPPAP